MIIDIILILLTLITAVSATVALNDMFIVVLSSDDVDLNESLYEIFFDVTTFFDTFTYSMDVVYSPCIKHNPIPIVKACVAASYVLLLFQAMKTKVLFILLLCIVVFRVQCTSI